MKLRSTAVFCFNNREILFSFDRTTIIVVYDQSSRRCRCSSVHYNNGVCGKTFATLFGGIEEKATR